MSSEVLRKYVPLLRQQFVQYVPQHKERRDEAVKSFVEFLHNHNRLEITPSLNERVFAFSLLFDYFAFCRNRFDREEASWPPSELRALLEGIPYYRQKCVCLLLADYPKDLIQNIFTVGPVLLYTAQEELQQKLKERNWTHRRINLATKQEIRQGKTSHCESESALANLVEGRLKWEDRGQVENHLEQCLHCLQNTVMIEEAGYFLKSLKPLSEAEAAAFWPVGAVGEFPKK